MAVRHARDVRKFHARRTVKGNKQREEDLMAARKRLQMAMEPLRSWRGGAHFRPSTTNYANLEDDIIEASEAIQGERRRIWKMQHPEWREASKRPSKTKEQETV